MKYTRKCVACGNDYKYSKFANQSAMFCSDNCKNVFDIASNIVFGVIDADTANEQLKSVDVSNAKNELKNVFKSIKPKKSVKKTDEVDE